MNGRQGALEQQALGRIEELVQALDTSADPNVVAPARELLQVVLDLHARGLNRMMGMVADSACAEALIEHFTSDESANALLLLHDLHPKDTAARVHEVFEQLRPHLAVQGIGISSVDVNEGVVRARLHSVAGSGGRRPPAAESVQAELEGALFSAAPELAGVRIEGLPVPTATVPLASVGRYRPGTSADG